MSRLVIDDNLRAIFTKIANYLIPTHEQMPSASEINVAGELLDRVLAVRPDIRDAFLRGLKATAELSGEDASIYLFKNDGEAFEAISTAAAGGYYLDEKVRFLIGYPGQESLSPDDPYALETYVEDGSLLRVFNRGPIYVPTPGEEAKLHNYLMKKG